MYRATTTWNLFVLFSEEAQIVNGDITHEFALQ